MVSSETYVDAPPSAVFEVLADSSSYERWVPGSNEIRWDDGRWPERGATFHHTQGKWPLLVKDTSTVLVSEPPTRLDLEVRTRPWLVARAEFRLAASNGGTIVRMTEVPTGGLVGRLLPPVVDLVNAARVREALRRLKRLSEQRAAAPSH